MEKDSSRRKSTQISVFFIYRKKHIVLIITIKTLLTRIDKAVFIRFAAVQSIIRVEYTRQ